ncbi:MAG: hypothetical protein ACFFBD_24660, partial [Candidatus Hodarchaeota archaeon]
MKRPSKQLKKWYYVGGIGFFWAIVCIAALATPASAAGLPEGLNTLEFFVNGVDLIQTSRVWIKVDEPTTLSLSVATKPGYTFTLYDISITVSVLPAFNLSATDPSIIGYFVGEDSSDTLTLPSIIFLDYTPVSYRPLVSSLRGVVPVTIQLHYSVNGALQPVWVFEGELVLPADTLVEVILSPVGVVAAGTTVITVAIIGWELLIQLLGYLLTKVARGQITKRLTQVTRSRVSKKECPRCNTRFEKGVCNTCKLTQAQVAQKYAEEVRDWAAQILKTGKGRGEITIQSIADNLGLSQKQAIDIYVAMYKVNLISAAGILKAVPKRIVLMGLTTGFSIVFWSLAGGFLPLSPRSVPISIIIIVALVIVPFLGFKFLLEPRRRARMAKL